MIRSQVRRNLGLVIATPLVVIVIVLYSFFSTSDQERINQVANETQELAVETHDALCALKADLFRRVTSTETYLERHPGAPGDRPFPGIDVTRAEIKDQLGNQRENLVALDRLKCKPPNEGS